MATGEVIAFDLAYELTLGAACGLSTVNRRRRFVDGALASALVYVPLCAVTLTLWPSWQLMELTPSSAALQVAQPIALLLCFAAGFFALPLRTFPARIGVALVWAAVLVAIVPRLPGSPWFFLCVSTVINAMAALILLRRAR